MTGAGLLREAGPGVHAPVQPARGRADLPPAAEELPLPQLLHVRPLRDDLQERLLAQVPEETKSDNPTGHSKLRA